MLPMTLQFIIVMIASALNDRLQRKLDYVEEERRPSTGDARHAFPLAARSAVPSAPRWAAPVRPGH
jgi:hypothetical protein